MIPLALIVSFLVSVVVVLAYGEWRLTRIIRRSKTWR
jgi:hypothetical protein